MWPEPERAWKPEERARWAAERRLTERVLPKAQLWGRALLLILDEIMDEFKASIAGAETARSPRVGELEDTWSFYERLRRLDGSVLVEEYRAWTRINAKLTAGLVHAGEAVELAEVRALCRWLKEVIDGQTEPVAA